MRHHGFTLVEAVFVVAILAVLSVLAIPLFMEYAAAARDSSASADAASGIQVLVSMM